MLAKYSRLVAYNATGATATVTVKSTRKKFDVLGVLTFSDPETTLINGASVANAAYANGTTLDNRAAGAGWLESDLLLTVAIASGSPVGSVTLYYQTSPNGTTWPDDGQGRIVGAINCAGTAPLSKTASFTVA
jgi:hypothetical protein